MGMFDTFLYKCPFCGEDTYCQTKLGENMLDSWRIGDKTTLSDLEFVGRDSCHECGERATFTIEKAIFKEVKKDPSDKALQEVIWGNLKPLGTDPDEIIEEVAKQMREVFKEIDQEE